MKFAFAFILALAVAYASAIGSSNTSIEDAFKSQSTVDIIINLKDSTAQVRKRVRAQSFSNLDEKATTLYRELKAFTAASQKEILSIISVHNTSKVKGFYLTNKISVKGATWELVQALSERPEIADIQVEPIVYLEEINIKDIGTEKAVEWGVSNIGAPAAWESGFTGDGIVVSHIDTGVRYSHEILMPGYRTEYGWFDPYEGTQLPNDQNGHGTHTMGTLAGRNGTGVAPGSLWIACKGCSTTTCDSSALISCFEWTFCPTLPDGSAPDCSKRPRVSSNSWAGGNDDDSTNDLVEAWNEVGIIPVFGIGNEGPECSSANSPGDQPNLLGVGATDLNNTVAPFSSHGPSRINLRIKPDLAAPGVDVRSSTLDGDNTYGTASGTSMATPHVAGAVAILLQRNSNLDLPAIAAALQNTALRPDSLENVACMEGGVDPNNPWPNNAYGYGKIDVSQALASV